ncbi:MAG: hypothetical protein IJW62_02140 [Clostridia bacterium]|nr:hypothetical protein [Clostridia bacterium]
METEKKPEKKLKKALSPGVIFKMMEKHFAPILKAHHYIRTAVSFYAKVQGDILISIQFACADNPARIKFCAQPYWSLDGLISNHKWYTFDGEIDSALAALDPVPEEQNTFDRFDRSSAERYFQQLGERFAKYLLPALERMTDFENYFREASAYDPDGRRLPQAVLRYCAIKDGNYYRFLKHREKYEACLNAFRSSASTELSPEQIEAEIERADGSWKRIYAELWEAAENNTDPASFLPVHEALCDRMQDVVWEKEHLPVGKYDSPEWRELLKPVKISVRLQRKFEPILLEQGFTRRKNGYFRLQGSLVQGVVLRPLMPFVVGIVSKPYWNFEKTDFAANSDWMSHRDLNMIIRAIDPDTRLGRGYAPGDPFQIEAEIDGQLAVFVKEVLPLMNEMTGLNEYLSAPEYMRRLSDTDLMAASLQDGNYDFFMQFIAKKKEWLNERREKDIVRYTEEPRKLEKEIAQVKKEIAEMEAAGEESGPELRSSLAFFEMRYRDETETDPTERADREWRQRFAALERDYALFLDGMAAGKSPEECFGDLFRKQCQTAKSHVENGLKVSIEKDW